MMNNRHRIARIHITDVDDIVEQLYQIDEEDKVGKVEDQLCVRASYTDAYAMALDLIAIAGSNSFIDIDVWDATILTDVELSIQ